MLKNIWFGVITICFISCKKDSYYYYIINKTKIGQVTRILILGNSIVKHSPSSAIGWNGNWGMAASSADSDFIHILVRDIKTKDTSCSVAYRNIADFEQNYRTFELSSLDSLKNIKPDIIIMRIGENVNDSAGEEFVKKYNDLINYVKTDNSVIVITDGFWPKKNVNHLIKNYASDNRYTFISMSNLSTPENEARGLFANQGVAMHPNNKGMRKIANRLWKYLSIYFN
jgi:hypothetical protein